jgi:hypothetical protein
MRKIGPLALRAAVAACLATIGYVHADLYLTGYREIKVIGPSFLWLASAAFAVALLFLVADPVVLRILALALSVGALGGFVLSRTAGVFGFVERGWTPVPQALVSVIAEGAVLFLIGAPVLARRLPLTSRSRASVG